MRAISSVGRAALLHSEGRGFESLIAHKEKSAKADFLIGAIARRLRVSREGFEKVEHIFEERSSEKM